MAVTTQLPFPVVDPLRPAQELKELRSLGAVHRVRTRVGDEAWLVTGYDEVRLLMDNDRLGRSHRAPQRAARSRASALFGGPVGNFDTEPVDHARMRTLLMPHFAARHLRRLEWQVAELCTNMLDEMARQGPPADFHISVARPLPIRVICDLLGVPYSERERFGTWVEAVASLNDEAGSTQAMGELMAYCIELVDYRHQHPGDDVVSRLCEHDLPEFEIATLAMHLLFAGYESTVSVIWMMALILLADRRRWEALQRDPSRIPKAVEETLRAGANSGFGIPRYAREDIEVGGVTVRAGDLVLLDVGSANHDPAAFDDPDTFDLNRGGRAHIAFGYGGHYCIGAALARLELNTVLTQLISRFPNMRLLSDPETIAVDFEAMADGLVELTVTW